MSKDTVNVSLFNRNVNAHCPSHYIYYLNGFITQQIQLGRHSFLCRIFFQRIQYISVGGCVAAAEPSENRQHPRKVQVIRRSQQPIGRLPEIENQQTPSRLQDAGDLPKTVFYVGKVSQPVSDRHQVKRVIPKRKIQCIRLGKADALFPALGQAGGGLVQHGAV